MEETTILKLKNDRQSPAVIQDLLWVLGLRYEVRVGTDATVDEKTKTIYFRNTSIEVDSKFMVENLSTINSIVHFNS